MGVSGNASGGSARQLEGVVSLDRGVPIVHPPGSVVSNSPFGRLFEAQAARAV